MSTQMKYVLSSILYKSTEFCVLCFSRYKKTAISMSDEVVYSDSNNCKVVLEILTTVLGKKITDKVISNETQICDKCLQLTMNAYKFIEVCKCNLNIINSLILNITSSAMEIEEPENCNTGFLVVNPYLNTFETYLDTKTEIPNIKKALPRLKTLQRSLGKCSDKEYVCKMCCREFATYLEAEKHCEQCPGPPRYKCNACSALFTNKLFLEKHYATIHTEDAFKIEMDKVCTIIRMDGIVLYQCKYCFTEFKKFSILQMHCKKIHGVVIEDSFQEVEIQKDVLTETVEKDSSCIILTQNEINAYQCNLCMITLPEYDCLQQHYEEIHKQIILKPKYEGILCSICGITFKNKSFLKRHEETHERTEILRSHEGIICCTCGKIFQHKSSLKRHELTHKGKEITCPICKKVYRRYAYYKQHVCNPSNGRNIHDKKIECDYCGKKFCHKAGVRNHIRYWHLSEGYYCNICNKRCANQAALHDHLLVHTKEKKFECTVCGRKFGVKSALKTHMRLHTGETPYPCEVCGMKFLSSSRRADHFRIHHGGPTKACDICSKKFHKTNQLNQHRQRHFKQRH